MVIFWIVVGAIAVLVLLSLFFATILAHILRRPPLLEGIITRKEHEPERKWIQLIPFGAGVARPMLTTYFPLFKFDDEDWVFHLEQCVKVDNRTKCRKGKLYVSHDTWEKVSLNSFYKAVEGDRTKDPVLSREATGEEIRKYS